MKILIATESYFPNVSGVAVFTHNLAKAMVARGHQVFVISPSDKYTEYHQIIDGVNIFRLESKDNKFRHGHFVSRFPFLKVPKIIKQVQPDVIHLQDPALISLSARNSAKKLKIPLIITNHFSLEYVITYLPKLPITRFLVYHLAGAYLDWFYSRCTVLTCPTQTVAKQFRKDKITKKIQVVSNGVDLTRFMPYYGDSIFIRKRFKIKRNIPLVLYVGRLDPDKNLETLISAAKMILRSQTVHFLLVGSGTSKDHLIKLCQNYDIYKNFTFVNFIKYSDNVLPKIYQASDIFIHPGPMETQSIVTLEALASGLPVVAANQGALQELVSNNVNGFLFQAKNQNDLAKKLGKLIKDEKLRFKMGKKSVMVVNSHIAEKSYDKFEDIYNGIFKAGHQEKSV